MTKTSRCCSNCFGDQNLKTIIQQDGIPGDCDYCGSTGAPCVPVEQLSAFVVGRLLRAFDTPPDDQSGSSAYWVLAKQSRMNDKAREAGLAVKLITAVPDSEREGVGPNDLLMARAHLARYGASDDRDFESLWDEFKQKVMWGARFFDFDEPRESHLEGLLKPLLEALREPLKEGRPLYRARSPQDEKLPEDPLAIQDELGPPPVRKAPHNRMSPAGISYLYLSGDEQTCIAEILPSVGSEVWVGRFEVLQDIDVIDLSKVREVVASSIFAPNFDWRLQTAREFLGPFIEEIARPPRSRDDPLHYIPTQILAEYIRKCGAQGIAYRSSQHRGGTNYALFCGPAVDPWHTPVGPRRTHGRPDYDHWVRLKEVVTVEVTGMCLTTRPTRTHKIDADQLNRPDSSQAPPDIFKRNSEPQ
jgi:hypothetical protein